MEHITKYYPGRINRRQYLSGSIGLGVVLFIIIFVVTYLFAAVKLSEIGVIVNIIVYVVGVVLSFGISARRWHDIGVTGWWNLLFLIPYVNFIVWLFLLFKAGNPSNNKFGSIPGRNFNIFDIILNK